MAAVHDSPRAWSVAVAVAMVNAIAFGITYSFGAFFDAMSGELGVGKGATALVFSLTLLLFFGFGAISGRIADRVGARPLILVGGALFCTGLLATSKVHSIGAGYVTYSLGVGLGAGCWVTPAIAAVGAWFQRRRALALGVGAAGSGVGTLVIAPLSARLIDHHGWRQAYVLLAAGAAVVLALASIAVARPPRPAPVPAVLPPAAAPPAPTATPQAAGRPGGASSLVRSGTFRLLFGSGLCMSIGLYVAFTLMVSFAKDNGVAPSRAALLIGLVGASSLGGRLGLTVLAGRLGPIRMYQLCLGVQPLAYLVWLAAGGRYGLLLAFAVLLGISYGGFVALGPEVVIHLFGVSSLGATLGLLYLGSGIGGLIGPVLAGSLADLTGGQSASILASVTATVVATLLTLRLPLAHRGGHTSLATDQ